MVYMEDAEVGVWIMVSGQKWANSKRLMATLHGLVLVPEWVDHKVLERIRVTGLCDPHI
jgi:hypothetical protein